MNTPQVFITVDSVRNAIAQRVQELVSQGNARPKVGLVPTMGALHDGHAALLDKARSENDVVVVSVFVNPLQFNDPVDYENYPRQLEADTQLVGAHGADLVFAPAVETMYPGYFSEDNAPQITVSAGHMGTMFEGASRPGHFDGVCTVVTKLWTIHMPPAPATLHSYFGQKDAQQLAILRRTASDLNIPVDIRPVGLVRAPSGLALSSRNMRLDDAGMSSALALSQALHLLRWQAEKGRPLNIDSAQQMIDEDKSITLDYLEVVDPTTLMPLDEDTLAKPLKQEALALVAAYISPVRLIDNMVLPVPSGDSNTQ